MRDCVLCFDFGAGSARLMAVFPTGEFCEVHRFANEPVFRNFGHFKELCWQPKHWLRQMKIGLQKAASHNDWNILSIGFDTWGADIAYFDDVGNLLCDPFCYRSQRTANVIAEVHARVPLQELYASGGNAFFPFNTIYQLYCDIYHNSELGNKIASFCFMPDFLLRLLSEDNSGRQTTEYCIASSSALCDAARRDWNWQLIDRLGLPEKIFPSIREAPYLAGYLSDSWTGQLRDRAPRVPLLKVASHDTAAAAANMQDDTCFLVCGTWFILGVVAAQPYLNQAAFSQNIVNEGAARSKHRVQKLFCGFWLLQQLRKEWQREHKSKHSIAAYQDLASLASQSRLEIVPDLNVDDASLVLPKQTMEQAICQLLGKPQIPQQDMLKIVYTNMGRACARHLESLRAITGKNIQTIYALGGGSQDFYFVRELSCVCDVKLGPAEASVLGNARLQFLYHGKNFGQNNVEQISNKIE